MPEQKEDQMKKQFIINEMWQKEQHFSELETLKTEETVSDDTLLESGDLSSSLCNISPNPILVINQDTSIRYVNPAFIVLTGFSASEILGRKAPYLWWTQETLEKTMQDLKDSMRNGARKLEELFQTKRGELFWVEISSAPVIKNGEFKFFLVNWIDITRYKRALEELRDKKNNLEEMNTALRVLLKSRDEHRKEIEEKFLFNVKQLILPYLEKLKNTGLNSRQKVFTNILEINLNDIISPFSRSLTYTYLNFTPSEVQVANFIKHGRTTKEIADCMSLSPETINSHRKNIRRKVGLRDRKANLRTYLLSIQQ